jgi:hypothetical protein
MYLLVLARQLWRINQKLLVRSGGDIHVKINICFLHAGSRISCLAYYLLVHRYAYSMAV